MKKRSIANLITESKIAYVILIVILLVASIFMAIQVKQYIGYTIVNATAGYITQIHLEDRRCTSSWGAFYGMAVMVYNYSGILTEIPEPCVAEQEHLLFPCLGRSDNEVYASLKPSDEIDWPSVGPASLEDINNYLNYTGLEKDSANATFTYNLSITIGTTTIYAPGTYTKQYGTSNPKTSFNLLALKDSNGTLIFATKIARLETKGFNNQDTNYQLLLPVVNGTNPTYYFFIDPYEECPAGYGYGEIGEGLVYGYVSDNTSGLPINQVAIYVSSVSNYTNTDGYYNFSVPYGYQYIVGVKDGYEPHVGRINISIGLSVKYNFSMAPKRPYLENGTIHGFVLDNSTQLPLANATVSAWGISFTTNSTGEYSLIVLEGTHNIVAIRNGYNNHIGDVNVTRYLTTEYNISMIELAGVSNLTQVGNGTITGWVFDNSTFEMIANATVSVSGNSVNSNTTGYYSIIAPEGIHNIIAIKDGYDNYINNVTVVRNSVSYHNISIGKVVERVITISGQGPGAGAGQGAGQGAGTGITTIPQAPIIEQPAEIVDYELSVDKIIKKVKVGTYITESVSVTNHLGDSMVVSFSIDGDVKPLIQLNKEKEIIESGSKGTVELTIIGNVEPGVYDGNLVISGDIEEKIPIYILVYDKEKLPIEVLIVELIPYRRKIYAGSELKFRVDLQNMLAEEKYLVSLSYSLQGINNNRTFSLGKEDIVILTSASLLKTFLIPKEMETGGYVLVVEAEYLGFNSKHRTIIDIAEPFYKYKLFGIIPLWLLLLILGIIGTIFLIYFIYKKKVEEKKRYKTQIDYTQLPKPGARSAYVGNIAETPNKTYFDLDKFQVHTIVAGASGSGKSVVAEVLAEEALMKKVAVVVFDPTAQWTGFLRRCDDKEMLKLYPKFSMKKTDAKPFNGNVHQIVNARELIDIRKYMKPGEINVFVTNKLDTEGNELLIANTIKSVFSANLPESRELIFLMIYDGIHTLLPKYGGSGKVFVQIERASREFRKWGVGLILVSQVLSDIPPEVSANLNTQVQMRTRDEGDLNRIKEEYGEDSLKSVVKAALGAGMVENSAYNKGKPYFISFRPPMHSIKRLSDSELENYNKYNTMIDDLDYQIEQLEKEGIDVFDLKLELKLAQDKVKAGNFNMVGIYLEGLIPRLEKQWQKMGKIPKKKKIQLIAEEELVEELDKAQEDLTFDKKKEGPKSEEKEKSKSSEQKKESEAQTEKSDQSEVNSLVDQANKFIDSNKKDKAKEIYSKLQGIYKKSPADVKKSILVKCVELQKRLR